VLANSKEDEEQYGEEMEDQVAEVINIGED
jgi:hypothetical protein